MNTMSDLRNWVDDMTSGWWERTDETVDAVANAIRNDPNRPNWGEDWTEYLDTLPDLASLLPTR